MARRASPSRRGSPPPPPYCCPYPYPYCTLPLTRHIQGPPTALGDTAGWGGARNLLWGGVPFGPFDAPTVHWNSLAYQHFANRCGFWSRGLSAPLMGPSHTLLIRHGRVSLFGFFELNFSIMQFIFGAQFIFACRLASAPAAPPPRGRRSPRAPLGKKGRAGLPPPPSVLSGHAASLTPYQSDTPRPSPRTAHMGRAGPHQPRPAPPPY